LLFSATIRGKAWLKLLELTMAKPPVALESFRNPLMRSRFSAEPTMSGSLPAGSNV